MKKEELIIAKNISKWLLKEYPNQIWRYDLADLKLTIGQAVQNKELNPHRGYPDFLLALVTPTYGGLYIEMKIGRSEVYRKDGKMKNNAHIQEQDFVLRILRARGYRAEFGLGERHIKELIIQHIEEAEDERHNRNNKKD